MENNQSAVPNQSQPAQTPALPGPSEDLAKRVAELEKANKGMLNDLQSEREKRQQYESELKNRQNPPPVAGNAPVNSDDPVRTLILQHAAPLVADAVNGMRAELDLEKTAGFLARVEKKEPDDIKADIASTGDLTRRLRDTIQKYGINKGSAYENTKAAYQLMKRDEESTAAAAAAGDASRNSSIQANASVTSSAPIVPGKVYTNSDVMSIRAGDPQAGVKLAEISKAIQEGRFNPNA